MSDDAAFCTCKFGDEPHTCDFCVAHGYSSEPNAIVYVNHPHLPAGARARIPLWSDCSVEELPAQLGRLVEVSLAEALITWAADNV